ncbi:MAG: lytic murein transglycosylase B [Methylovulum sp.]|nr:lytic murein transglycosylase B [Methylovulum sp.]MCF7999041.1 lytic murein transglycosylase B [Methylovulum sp.]
MRLKNLLPCLYLGLSACSTLNTPPEAVQVFVDKLVNEHQFDRAELSDLMSPLQPQADILKKITRPAEALPWYRYRKLFLNDSRIDEGVKFWQDHAQLLAEAQRHYGVPAEIIVAIIGVETRYGQHTGKHRVLDALYTLAFDYPARSAFFQKELENYLLLCREEHLNPADLLGSYAGAMGMPQFMPSSFRNYAADFDRDGRRDIWHNDADVIASIANYFAKHHWQVGQGIALPATVSGTHYQRALNNTLKPDLRLAELESLDLKISVPLALDTKVKVLALKQEQGEELWVGLDNFYCLTRYNQSPLYAMAVFQLSQAIVNKLALNRKGAFP